MDSWFWACPDVTEENTGTKTGGDPKGKVEDEELEAVEVMCIKGLKLLGSTFVHFGGVKTSTQDGNDTQSVLKEFQRKKKYEKTAIKKNQDRIKRAREIEEAEVVWRDILTI